MNVAGLAALIERDCYETVSRQNLGENCLDHRCTAPNAAYGYRFSEAMKNPAFISIGDIQNVYVPMGFTNFKIEGRGLGSAIDIRIFIVLYDQTRVSTAGQRSNLSG